MRVEALRFQFGEVIAEQADVAVEVGLRLRVEAERPLGVVREGAEEEAGALAEPFAKPVAGEVEVVRWGRVVIVVCRVGLGRFLVQRIGELVEAGLVEEGEERVVGEVVE